MRVKYFIERVLVRLGWNIRLERVKKLPQEVEKRFRNQTDMMSSSVVTLLY